VADALEALARVASSERRSPFLSDAENGTIRFARTCYDHLAGVLGVLVTEGMVERGYLVATDGFELTAAGRGWLASLGADVGAMDRGRRVVARTCLDWTERRNHLAGAAGAAVAACLLDSQWVKRVEGTRIVRLTLRGREGLRRSLDVDIDATARSERALQIRKVVGA
jgi:hypothetical protein